MAQNEDYKKAEKLCKSSLLNLRMSPDWYGSYSYRQLHVTMLLYSAHRSRKGNHANPLQRLLQGHSDTSL